MEEDLFDLYFIEHPEDLDTEEELEEFFLRKVAGDGNS